MPSCWPRAPSANAPHAWSSGATRCTQRTIEACLHECQSTARLTGSIPHLSAKASGFRGSGMPKATVLRPNPSIEGMPKRLRLLCTPHVKRWAFANIVGAIPSSSLFSTAVPCEGAYCEGLRFRSGIRGSRSSHSHTGRLAPRTLVAGLRFQGQHLSSAQVWAASGLSFLPPRKPNPAFKRTCLRHAA